MDKSKYELKLRSLVSGKNVKDISEEILGISEQCTDKTVTEIRKDFCEMWDKVFNEKVEELCQPNLSPLEEKIIRAPIEEWLKFIVPDAAERLRMIEARKKLLGGEEREIKLKTFKELFYSPKNKREFIVSELIPKQSLLMFIGYGKIGKTRFITSLCAAVAEGRNFLGRKTKKSKILFIQNESTLEEAANLMYYAGLQNIQRTNEDKFREIIDSDNICFLNYVDISLDSDKIFEQIRENEIDFVVIDSLTASVQLGGLTEQSKEIASVLYAFQHQVKKHNIACVLIHHCTKGSKDATTQQDMLMSMAGSNTIVRANDGVIALLPGQEPGTLRFQAIVRHIPELQLTLRIQSGLALYTEYMVTKSSTTKQETLDLVTKIVEELQNRKQKWEKENEKYLHQLEDYFLGAINIGLSPVEGITPIEATRLFECTEAEFGEATNWMLLVNGVQHRVQRGQHLFYFGEKEDSWLLSLLCKKEEEEMFKEKAKEEEEIIKKRKEKEINAKSEALVKAETREEILEIINHWSTEERKEVVDTLTDEQYQVFARLVKPPKFEEGNYVTYKNKEYVIVDITSIREDAKRPWYYSLESAGGTKEFLKVSQDQLIKGVVSHE